MSGKTDQIKGRAKEAAGALLGDKRLEREGKIERVTGSVKEKAKEVVQHQGQDKRSFRPIQPGEVLNKAKSNLAEAVPDSDRVRRYDGTQWHGLMAVLALVFLWWLPALAGAADLTSSTDIDRSLTIDSIHSELGQVSGVIRNRSSQPVSEVTLLIQQTYLWPNEFKPVGESPSRAVVRKVAGPIGPGDSMRFDEAVPVPQTARGSFEARAEILGYRYEEANSSGLR